MNEVGNKILAANHITTPILFRMAENAMDLDAKAESKHHLVVLGSALFPMFSSDDELAAVLSHEIAHVITGKSGHLAGGQISLLDILGTVIFVPDAIITTMSMGNSIKERLGRATLQNRETAMDLIGIDLMVKAGYNPTAMENILREIATDNGNKHWRNRVTITDRLKRIHTAIATKYPDFVPEDERMSAPQKELPGNSPANTVSLPADGKGVSISPADTVPDTQKTTHHLEDAPQVEVPGIPVMPVDTTPSDTTKASMPKSEPALKERAPSSHPAETSQTPAVQRLLDQNGQPIPVMPPGLSAALKLAN
jgi:Zn-dependent protease with chaperone function